MGLFGVTLADAAHRRVDMASDNLLGIFDENSSDCVCSLDMLIALEMAFVFMNFLTAFYPS